MLPLVRPVCSLSSAVTEVNIGLPWLVALAAQNYHQQITLPAASPGRQPVHAWQLTAGPQARLPHTVPNIRVALAGAAPRAKTNMHHESILRINLAKCFDVMKETKFSVEINFPPCLNMAHFEPPSMIIYSLRYVVQWCSAPSTPALLQYDQQSDCLATVPCTYLMLVGMLGYCTEYSAQGPFLGPILREGLGGCILRRLSGLGLYTRNLTAGYVGFNLPR